MNDIYDGLPSAIEINGTTYAKTGNRDGWGVYIRETEWNQCCRLDAKLFVHRDGELIPIGEYTTTAVRAFTPYAGASWIKK